MQTEIQNKLWNKSYILILTLSIITSIGFAMITPIVVKYAISLGATVGLAGTIAGIFSITALFGRPVSGYISDRYNKKNIMILSTVMLAVSTLGYGISANASVLLFFRVLHGLAFSVSGTASISLGTAFIPQKRLGEGIGFLGMGYIIARAIGPNIGIFILDKYGYSYVFFAAFAIIALSAALMFTIKYKMPVSENIVEKKKKFKIKLSDLVAKELLVIAAIAGCFSMMNGLISSFLVNLGEEKNIIGVGIYFTVNAAVLLFIRPFAGKLLDKKGIAYIVYPSFILAILSAFFIGMANSLWMIIIAAVLYAVGQGSSQPALQTSCIKRLGPERVGVATSTYYIGADIGNGLGPMIGGAVAGAVSFSSVYFVGMGVLFLGMLLFHFCVKNNKLGGS